MQNVRIGYSLLQTGPEKLGKHLPVENWMTLRHFGHGSSRSSTGGFKNIETVCSKRT